jgi:hypothetical protein
MLTAREICCLLEEGGNSVSGTSWSFIFSSGGGIMGVFMRMVSVSAIDAMVKPVEGIEWIVAQQLQITLDEIKIKEMVVDIHNRTTSTMAKRV